MGDDSIETKKEGETPLFSDNIKRAHKAFTSEDWRDFKKNFEENKEELLEDFDLYKNTAINVAIRSDIPILLRDLLDMLSEQQRWLALTKKNCIGNTLLHEIAFFCKVPEMAKVVFELEKKMPSPEVLAAAEEGRPLLERKNREDEGGPLLERKNREGETPLFTAARCGNLKMVTLMVNHAAAQTQSDMTIHLHSSGQTILHASINRQFFDVTLWLIRIKDVRSLLLERDKSGLTCLQVLARMPTAFRSHEPMGCLDTLIYNWLPDERYDIEGHDCFELSPPTSGLSRINYAVWKYLAKVFSGIQPLWKRKKDHQLAESVAKFLVRNDYSWQKVQRDPLYMPVFLPSVLTNVVKRKKQVERIQEKRQEYVDGHVKHFYDNLTPLLVAAGNGITEIVQFFLEEHPQSVDHVSEDKQNILHIAVKHRQLTIFKLLEKNPDALRSLAYRISKEEERTVMHQVARMDYYRPSQLPGAAFQLQDELKWYKQVEQYVPPHLLMHCDDMGLTAGDLLDIEHDKMLADAQLWIKQTAESCSTVSVLVATVVFAAAYTIPGGSEGGTPVYLRSPVFIFFTVMDIVALAFSLASVVMFLSILTSPFELWDFHKSLPRKLTIGFAFLFCSLITTMLAFSATILLTVRLQWENWTSTLVYGAAFFPVTIFGLIQFPLYGKIPGLMSKLYEKIMKVIPIDRAIKGSRRWIQRAKYP